MSLPPSPWVPSCCLSLCLITPDRVFSDVPNTWPCGRGTGHAEGQVALGLFKDLAR